ncbi:EamA family transporter [Pauljensenia sp. UMB1235]|uniref:EamA family transporter n=1 Tax=unclassified Pauljensenia TaxID=2908895 RepID=UPI00254DFB4D|nr:MULTISPECIES: EamA family transporter [unclassified Pauljensenia]MDK6400986.1 EamA family transporter [Pauljensenia sp. UMB9872]MDK7173506.1 EamA family transporter [Pauljensenia sp. UMB1235]
MPSLPSQSRLDRVPAQFFIVGSALIQYVGAAIAIDLFAQMSPASVAWWRVLVAAIILLAWRRPWREKWSRKDCVTSMVFGVFIISMNSTFYEAIARLPLGAAVSLEFLGPVLVAVLRGRGPAPRIAALLAFAGVVSISGLGLDLDVPGVKAGIVWILLAATAWAGYIMVGQKLASKRSAVSNLAASLGWGALFSSVVLAPGGVGGFTSVHVFGALVVVGVLSTVIPFSLEALAMSRVSAATFALFTAMLPATSTIVGAVMLRQVPTLGELGGLVLISIAVWIASSPRFQR